MDALIIIFLLSTKHLIIDFPLQVRYQYSNKGTYGHPGGLLHAFLHFVGTFVCLYWFTPALALYLALADAVLHYHIDWAKMNINRVMGWGPTTHEQFWWLTGFDQYLHIVTYIGLTYFAIGAIM